MNEWREKEIKELIANLSKCETEEEVGLLLDAILTPREVNDIARRLKILILLEEGKTYSEIYQQIGASCDMVSKVSARIGYGFRRSHGSNNNKKPTSNYRDPLTRKRTIKYKGATSIVDIILNK